jgi:formylmethanofuran dehydrogenase subunit B
MSATTHTINDVACTMCACVCDDLKITVTDGRISRAERSCNLSEAWFLGQNSAETSVAAIRGQRVELEAAVSAAAEILRSARAPLIYGLSRSSTEGQRAAIALADRLGATIDTTASEGHAPSILAMQTVGESTCSLGEIRNRADLVIYWGADPVESHGLFVPRGRADRTLVVLNAERTATAELADVFLPVKTGYDFEAIWTLRGLLRGIEPAPGTETGLPLDDLKRLAERMKSCRCGVIFFGYGVVRQPLGHRQVEALLRLVTDLNQFTRFHARRLRVAGNVTGADSVLCWQTGFPFGVNLARGFPRYNPGEYTAGELLARKEVDAAVLVGTWRASAFSQPAMSYLRTIPTIVLDHAAAVPPIDPTVRFTTAIYGIHRPGTAYRMDEVPIQLRPVLDSTLPSDDEVLRSIYASLFGASNPAAPC